MSGGTASSGLGGESAAAGVRRSDSPKPSRATLSEADSEIVKNERSRSSLFAGMVDPKDFESALTKLKSSTKASRASGAE